MANLTVMRDKCQGIKWILFEETFFAHVVLATVKKKMQSTSVLLGAFSHPELDALKDICTMSTRLVPPVSEKSVRKIADI